MSPSHPRSLARDFTIQFLYQCETEKVYYYHHPHFAKFTEDFDVPKNIVAPLEEMVRGVFDNLDQLDSTIEETATNWKMNRMAVTDRSVLRLGAWELQHCDTPPKVVLDEAINLAKKYGTAESGPFVNGILDSLRKIKS